MSKKAKESLRSGDVLPPLTRTFDLVRGSLDEDKRTVEVTFSTENPVERWFGVEVLDHSAGSVRMDRITDGAPFLMDHDLRDQRGVVESAEIKSKEGCALVRFSRSERGQELLDEVKDGIRTKISVGYRVHQFVITENGNSPDEYRATDWEPLEISSVSIPADTGARTRAEYDESQPFGVRAAELGSRITVRQAGQPSQPSKPEMNEKEKKRQEEIRAIAKELGVADDDLKRAIEDQELTAEAFRSQHQKNEPEAPQEPDNGDGGKRGLEPAGASPEDLQRLIDKSVSADRERCEEIRSLGQAFGLSDDDIAKAIRENATVDSVKLSIIERQRTDPANAPIPTARVSEPQERGERGTKEFMLRSWHDQASAYLRSNGFEVPAFNERVVEIDRSNRPDPNNIIQVRALTGIATLADVAVMDAGIGSPIIDETTYANPEIGIFPVDTVSGAEVKLTVRTGLPTVGARNVNEGTDWKAGTYESELFELAIMDERAAADIALLKTSKNPSRILTSRATDVTEAVMNHICVQTWYGSTTQSGADAKFTPGIYAQYSADTDHEVDATGSTAKTSVWVLALGIEKLDHVYGADTFLNFRDTWDEETVEDANGKKFRALTNYLNGLVGVRLANKNAAIRIKNIGTDTGKGLTDNLLAQAFELVENLGMMPTAIMMNPRSKRQLQTSRTTYSPVGAPAPIPQEYNGVPIVTTKNLSNAETI